MLKISGTRLNRLIGIRDVRMHSRIKKSTKKLNQRVVRRKLQQQIWFI